MQSNNEVKIQPRKRLKKNESEVAVGKSRKPSCLFYNQTGHKIPNCHVRNSHKSKYGPELDTKASTFGLISQIEHCDINALCDKFSGHPMSNLTNKQMTFHMILDKTVLKHHYDRLK